MFFFKRKKQQQKTVIVNGESEFVLGTFDDSAEKAAQKENFELLKKAADSGDKTAFYPLGLCYFNGTGVERDGKKALEYFKKSVDYGISDGLYGIAKCYDEGVGVAENGCRAAIYYKRAAKTGNNDARYKIAYSYLLGSDYFYNMSEKELEDWAKSCDEAIEDDAPDDEIELDDEIDSDDGDYTIPPEYEAKKAENLKKAIEIFEIAANDGHIPSQNELGDIYFYGLFFSAELQKAAFWYTKAAEAGDSEAMYKLTNIYHFSRLDDKAKYKRWLKKSVELGNQSAMNYMLFQYINILNDYKSAIDLARRALKTDFTGETHCKVAEMYLKGYGVERDLAVAEKYATKSLGLGYKYAQDVLEKINLGR